MPGPKHILPYTFFKVGHSVWCAVAHCLHKSLSAIHSFADNNWVHYQFVNSFLSLFGFRFQMSTNSFLTTYICWKLLLGDYLNSQKINLFYPELNIQFFWFKILPMRFSNNRRTDKLVICNGIDLNFNEPKTWRFLAISTGSNISISITYILFLT